MLPAFGLYTHIQANRRRSALLIAGLFILFYLMTYGLSLLWLAFADDGSGALDTLLSEAATRTLWLAPLVTAIVGVWIWCAARFNAFILGLATGANDITRAEETELFTLLQNLCISRGLSMPRLRIIETDAPNAYASGMRPEQYTITVTRGLLDRLDKRELEAVLAHELTHIRNGDVRTMMIAVLVVGLISFIGEFAWRSLGSVSRSATGSGKKGGGRFAAMAVALALLIVAWMLSIVIRFSLSRRREYLADAGAVELTHNADAMISALRKIEGKGELQDAPSAVMELCLDNPRKGFSDLFATHPSIEDRIDALVRYAGGQPVIDALPSPAVAGDPAA
ncbi:M48 family metallopeptidase [Microvirga brassicacearum]|uniref:M48 family metallopeptidase n=1 Tax=Microvirga brassicacearum TaxID=2580413 RepID=A0A5N3P7R8_9HYPH|nr:M48 family metallopeptidase [Microvirga brassicacearum]KAB0265779.1 M48 family metallopeptidase [Microvirga brassicacearum]